MIESAQTSTEASSSAFGAMDQTPDNHFALHFHAGVYSVLAFVRALEGQEGEETDGLVDAYPFLGQYLAEDLQFMPDGLTWHEGGHWWWDEIQKWEDDAEGHLPLRTLRTQFGLSRAQRLAFVVAGVLEEDSRFGTLFANLQAPVKSRRPTVELIGRIVKHFDAEVSVWEACQPLLDAHLLRIVDRSRPRAEWGLRVPVLIWEAARGRAPAVLESGDVDTTIRRPTDVPSLDDVIVPAEARSRLVKAPGLLQSNNARTLILRGTPGSDRLAALAAVAGSLDRGVIEVDWPDDEDAECTPATLPDGIGPFCVLSRLMPVLQLDLAPGASRPLPKIPGYEGPVGVALSPTGGLTGEGMDAAVSICLGALSAAERRRHWQEALGETPVEDLDAIVRGFQLPGRYLQRAAAAATRHAVLDGAENVSVRHVRSATRDLGRQLLDTLAERLEVDGSWDQLVVDPRVAENLHALERRCLYREEVLNHLGPAFGEHTTKGVRVLFTGPSGTGKTLAARILASELGMDLYRVDLASVINKYVGETEKNLHRVLSTAEELDVILLLDEGDALLGKRTDVSTANDRYANVETNYLLQRLEHYSGIVIVTSNLADNIDPAFQRRMDRVIDFSPPSAEERLAIWSIHLPENHAVSEETLRRVATECVMNGGQIRNAALQATLLALDDGSAADDAPTQARVRATHVRAAIANEYQKDGDLSPLDVGDDSSERTGSAGAQRFVDGMGS